MNLRELYRKPTPLEMAAQELVEAEHAKLAAQSAAEYAASIVVYNDKRINRLRAYIGATTTITKGETA